MVRSVQKGLAEAAFIAGYKYAEDINPQDPLPNDELADVRDEFEAFWHQDATTIRDNRLAAIARKHDRQRARQAERA